MDYYNYSPTAQVRFLGISGIQTPDGLVHLSVLNGLVKSSSRSKHFPACQGSFEEPGFKGFFHPVPTAYLGSGMTFKDSDPISIITCQDCIDHAHLQVLEEEYYCSHCQDSHIPANEVPAWAGYAYPASC